MYIAINTPLRSTVSAIIADLLWPLIFFGLSIGLTVPFFVLKTTKSERTVEPRCLPSGVPYFPWNRTINEFWDPSTALFITLGYGNYTYVKAKAIDVIWDLLVGRGGQILAAVMGYCVVRKSMMYSMELAPVPLPIAYSVYFNSPGLSMIGSMLRNILGHLRTKKQGTRGPAFWRLLCWIYICVYVTLLPTLMSAMTGYQTTGKVFFHPESTSSSLLAPGEYLNANPPLAVRDGSRIGLSDDAVFDLPPLASQSRWFDGHGEFNYTYDIMLDSLTRKEHADYYAIQNAVANTSYAITFGGSWDSGNFMGSGPSSSFDPRIPVWSYCTISQWGDFCKYQNSSWTQPPAGSPARPTPATTWSNITLANQTFVLQPPPLDIVVTGPTGEHVHGEIVFPPNIMVRTASNPAIAEVRALWLVKTIAQKFSKCTGANAVIDYWSIVLSDDRSYGGYYTNDSVTRNAICQPTTQYQWGFSVALLLLFCSLTAPFAGILLVLELEVYWCSRANRVHEQRNGYKDCVHVVQALREGFDVSSEEALLGQIKGKKGSGGASLAVQTERAPRARFRGGFETPADIPLLAREAGRTTTAMNGTVLGYIVKALW